MKRTVVLLAAVVALAGCGTETATSSAEEPTTTSSSEEPTEEATEEATEEPEEPTDKPEDEPGEGEATVPSDAPACTAVWRDGTRLARDYTGCMADGEYVAADQEPCSFGQRLVRYADRFYAVRGGPVNRTAVTLEEDRTYRGAIASCRG